MSRALLIGPLARGGGEGVYVDTVARHPPPGWSYEVSGDYHQSTPGARCRSCEEVLLNRVVRPMTIPDMGFRSVSVRGDFDLVHVHAHPVRIRSRRGVPVVMSEGSSSYVYLSGYTGWSDERIASAYARTRRVYARVGVRDRLLNLERVDLAYVFSSWARDINLGWGADPDKVTVVAPGFPVPPLDRREPESTHTRFLFIGTDFARKGGFDVVEAFAMVRESVPSARLRLVTTDPAAPSPDHLAREWVDEGRRRRVLAELDRLEACGAIDVGPLVDRAGGLTAAYRDADVFVMPTLAEGFGFTNIEAMSYGLPVISTTYGPIPEVVLDGETGILVAPADVRGLADAMACLATDRRLVERLGDAARGDFVRRFSIAVMRDAISRVYHDASERAAS